MRKSLHCTLLDQILNEHTRTLKKWRKLHLRRVLWDLILVGRHVTDISLVEPLDPEVAVEVGGGLAEPGLLVLLQGVLHVGGKQAPQG